MDGRIEAVARAICKADGFDPEYLEPGDCGYRDNRITIGGNVRGEAAHFLWRHYEKHARAALSALSPKDGK